MHPRSAVMRAAGVLGAAVLAAGLAAASAAPARAAAGAPAAAGHSRSHSRHPYLTPGQASAKAARTGKPVPVAGATTPSSTLTANPDGSFTLAESAAPVRAKAGGTWRALDASLVRDSGGTWSPAVSSQPLKLSGGGTGPLAVMSYGAYSLSLTAPMALPAPSVKGSTATYRSVLPGVDLIVTASASGGLSEVFRVASAAAAANPALKALTFTARASGLTLKKARGGVITAARPDGQVIFAAPAPVMWDSAVRPGLKTVKGAGGTRLDLATGRPAASTAAGPGDGAHTARLSVSVHGGRLTLAPPRAALAGAGTVYPEYIDPTWDSAGSSASSSWAYVSSDYPAQQYYDTSSYLQTGKNPDTGGTSYAFYSMAVPSQIRGAYVNDAKIYFPEVWSYSCTASPVDLYQTGAISSSTTYDSQPSWGAELGSDNVAYGWSSSGLGGTSPCPVSDHDVAYDIKSTIAGYAAKSASQSWPALTVGLKAEDTTDSYGWKQFSDPKDAIATTASMTITYAFPPAVPALSTSPAADCTAGTSVLGNGNVMLDAAVYDKDGTTTGSLAVTYTAYAAGSTSDKFASNSTMTVDAASGTTAVLELKQADLQDADTTWGSGGQVPITWTATVSDGLTGVPTSTAACSFIFSTATPGAPDILNSAGKPCGSQTYTAGTPASFTLNADTSGAQPTAYTYQLNGGTPLTKTAGTSSPYSADISVTPDRQTNVLTVVATAAGGNLGQASTCVINADAAAPAADQDMNGDGIPDLVTAGNGTTGTAAGLWLADGQSSGSDRFDGTVAPNATDIAPYGPQGISATAGPAAWNGLKAITGQFYDHGFNDIEAYAPGTGDVYLLPGQGDGSAAASQDQNLTTIFNDKNTTTNTVYSPMQLVNAYNVSGDNKPYPDQIGLFNPSSSSSTGYLAYFTNNDGISSFDGSNNLPYELSNATPDGTMDWADWTITTDTDTRGGTAYTDMWLRNQATGALYLWELTKLSGKNAGGCVYIPGTDGAPGTVVCTNPTATLTVTQTEVSGSFDAGTPLTAFQGTDVNGEPGLLTVTTSGQVQSFAWNGTALTQANASTPAQHLLTADHTYLLDNAAGDGATGTASSAVDQPGAGDTELDLASYSNSGNTWTTAGSTYGPALPDLALHGGSKGYMVTPSENFAPDQSFTVSALVNPSALGGTVFSENGDLYSDITVSSTASGQWTAAMNGTDTSTSDYTSQTRGTARAGMWTSLVLTYDTSGGADLVNLYVDGTETLSFTDTTPPTSAGRFILGARQVDGAAANEFTGQVADLQVWQSLAVPVQPPTPDSALVPVTPVRIMDTRTASQVGPVAGPVAAGATVTLPIDGNTTAGLPSNVTAVAVSISSLAATSNGNLTAYPSGTPLPYTATVAFPGNGTTATNNAIVPVGPDGAIAIHNGSAGTTQVTVDLTGYLTTTLTTASASTYTPLAGPVRILDTRNGTGAAQKPIPAAFTFIMTIAGDNTNGAGIPSTGVTAIALNITAMPASGNSGYLVTYPDGTAKPGTANLSYDGQPQAGTIIIPVGTDGKIDIYNASSGSVNLTGDLSGYFTTSTTGQHYHPLDATRLFDTRQTSPIASAATLTTDTPASITADNPTLILNLTAIDGTDSGNLAAYPASAGTTATSIIAYAANQAVANLALLNTATSSAFTIQNNSAGSTDAIADASGYFQ